VDGRADLYSLACVVHEMLAGAPPFQRADHLELLWAHQYDPPPALSKQRPDIPVAADDVLKKALAKAPDGRHDSCLEFVADLRAAVADCVPRCRTPTVVDRVAPPEPPAWARPFLI
jgi:serine/threonine-protein kinase